MVVSGHAGFTYAHGVVWVGILGFCYQCGGVEVLAAIRRIGSIFEQLLLPWQPPHGCGYILRMLPLTLHWRMWPCSVVVNEGHDREFAVWRLPLNPSIRTHHLLGLGKGPRVR